jgi:hypothetical protein
MPRLTVQKQRLSNRAGNQLDDSGADMLKNIGNSRARLANGGLVDLPPRRIYGAGEPRLKM